MVYTVADSSDTETPSITTTSPTGSLFVQLPDLAPPNTAAAVVPLLDSAPPDTAEAVDAADAADAAPPLSSSSPVPVTAALKPVAAPPALSVLAAARIVPPLYASHTGSMADCAARIWVFFAVVSLHDL